MDMQSTWANSAPVSTNVVIAVTKPISPLRTYELIINNASLVSDLTVKVFSVEKVLGGTDKDSLVTTLTFPKTQTVSGTLITTYSKTLSGMFTGGDLKLVLSNDTALGVADTFVANIRMREV